MTRRKPLLFVLFVMAAGIFLQGISVAHADTDTKGEQRMHPHAIRDPRVDSNLTPAQRARLQRDASVKRRHAVKQLIHDVAEGKQPAASDHREQGVAK